MEVKHKYVAMYHRSLQHFNEMFPDETGMMSFDTDPENPGKLLEQIRPLLSARAVQAETLVAEYGKGVLPMCFIMDDPIDAWSLLVGKGIQIDVCDGSEDERSGALGRLTACAGLILDPLACWIAGKIGVLDALQRKFGRLGVTATTLDLLRAHRDRLSDGLGQSQGTLWEEDGLVRFQPRFEPGLEALLDTGDITNWFEANAVVLRAISVADFSSGMRELGGKSHPSILDTASAASGSGFVLISEDSRLRALLQSLPGVGTAWLQVALLAAFQEHHLDLKTYDAACIHLVVLKHHFTSFGEHTLLQAAAGEGWTPVRTFEALSLSLASPTIEAKSATRTVAAFLFRLWKRPHSRQTKERLANSVLRSCKQSHTDRVPQVQALLNLCLESKTSSLGREDASA